MASPSTFSRFFAKFTHENNSLILPQMKHAWWERTPIQRVTVVVDSTVIQPYGHLTEGAAKGYNPTRHGGRSHYPIMAFCEELNMAVNQCMRPGAALASVAATEAAFALVMLAYNIMALFKQHVLKSNQQLLTIRFQRTAIGSYLVTSGRKTTLKLCAEGKRRHFLELVFGNVEDVGKMLAA